jgi:hypothetical protein
MSVATLIGYLGSALVVASLSMRSILKLRIIGLAGAFTFVAYGYLIDAWPIVLTNVVIVGIQLAFLREILTAEEYFRLLEVRPDSPYLDVFLDRYGSEIAKIWPDFSQEEASGRLTIFVLRDLVPAGLFVANVTRPSVLELRVDFVIPGYRDFKIGRHLYHSGSLLERGFTRITAVPKSSRTADYLRRMGFGIETEDSGGTSFALDLEPGGGRQDQRR